MGARVEGEIRSLVEASRRAGRPDEFRATALSSLQRLVGCESSLFLPFDQTFLPTAPDHVRLFGSKARYRQGMERIFAYHVYVDTLLFTSAERDRLPLFRELLRPLQISSTIVAAVNFRGAATGVLHLYRQGRTRAFSRTEQERIMPVLGCIGALHAALASAVPSQPPSSTASTGLARLTPREYEIANLVADGLHNHQIASRLGRSPHTVRHQLESIFGKCQLFSRTDLALLVRSAQRPPDAFDGEQANMMRVIERVQRTVQRWFRSE